MWNRPSNAVLALLTSFSVIEARDPTKIPPGSLYVDFNGLPIMFIRGKIPICPLRYLEPDNWFGYDTATRFSHWENCHKFWVCGHDHKPIPATCPLPQYFNPDTQLCDTLETKCKRPGKIFPGKKKRPRRSSDETPLERKKRAVVFKIANVKPEMNKILDSNKEYPLHDIQTVVRDEQGYFRCPPPQFKIKNHSTGEKYTEKYVLEKAKKLHFNFQLFYDTNYFVNTGYTTHYPAGCNQFYVCSAQAHFQNNNIPELRTCQPGFLFQPIRMKMHDLSGKFRMIHNTGNCVAVNQPSNVVKGCEDFKFPVITTPLITPQDTFKPAKITTTGAALSTPDTFDDILEEYLAQEAAYTGEATEYDYEFDPRTLIPTEQDYTEDYDEKDGETEEMEEKDDVLEEPVEALEEDSEAEAKSSKVELNQFPNFPVVE